MTMGRIRFSSPGAYESFKVLFAETRHHLMKLPGFIHLTWWEHPEDPNLFCEISIWASKEAVNEWHRNGFHQHAKMWAQNGAIMEALINNFTLDGNRILRMCPTCHDAQSEPYDLETEQVRVRQVCPTCGFHFPYMTETPSSFMVGKDIPVQSANGHAQAASVEALIGSAS
jgi:heme-degrading monooxygenase HmoA